MANTYTFRTLVKLGLFLSVVLSLVVIYRYSTGIDLPDENLFSLLLTMRFFSFFVCVFSIYLFITSIMRFISRPSPLGIAAMLLYLLAILLGAGLIFFNIFIVAMAGGNV